MTDHETDLVLWSEEQARALREAARALSNVPIDFENVAEEIESLGRSDRRALSARILLLLEHMLKLDASPAANPRSGWPETIIRVRREVDKVLRDSPSLRRQVPGMIEDGLCTARELVALQLQRYDEEPRAPLDSLTCTPDQVLGR